MLHFTQMPIFLHIPICSLILELVTILLLFFKLGLTQRRERRPAVKSNVQEDRQPRPKEGTHSESSCRHSYEEVEGF